MKTMIGTQVAQVTVGSLIERYLSAGVLEPSTLEVRRRALDWALGDIFLAPADSLSGLVIEKAFLARKDRASGAWINTCGSAIRSFVSWCVQREALPRDVSRFWPRVRAISQRCTDPLTPQELERMVDTARGDLRLLLLLGVFTGMRRANLCGLDWSWISSDWILTIPAGVFKQRPAHRQALHPRLIEELRPLRKDQGPVLPGIPSPGHVGRALKALGKKCGVDPRKLYPHALRATFATRLSLAGANLKQIAQLGGWASVEVLAQRYIRDMSPDEARSIMGRM